MLCEIFHVILCADAGEIDCEPPNNRLHKFVGVLTMNDQEVSEEDAAKQYSLDNDKILLRVSRDLQILVDVVAVLHYWEMHTAGL